MHDLSIIAKNDFADECAIKALRVSIELLHRLPQYIRPTGSAKGPGTGLAKFIGLPRKGFAT
jgi:hypothetical protein